ncbi:MAG TPA: PIN domain-containing protein [Vicinamibacteria bacterium]|nr:PIN domain-containing protein [Vicinamibacteria bacterium]
MFVDSSAWYAAADRSDLSHRRATAALGAGEALVTSDHVLVETWLLLRHRLGRAAAERFWDGLRSGVADVEAVVPADLATAAAVTDAFPDQDFSIVDRTSFAVMMRLGLRRVATFDDDFAVFRFGRGRKLAFEIVR